MQPLYPPKEGETVITQLELENAMDIFYAEEDSKIKSKKYYEALKLLEEVGFFERHDRPSK